MAIVFISPKKKQRVFFWGITMSLVSFVIIISVIVVMPELLNKTQIIPAGISYDKPFITINLDAVDSLQVKNLEPFVSLETEFAYNVKDQHGKQTAGNISAATKDDAQKLLEGAGFSVLSLQEVMAGRSDPFTSY